MRAREHSDSWVESPGRAPCPTAAAADATPPTPSPRGRCPSHVQAAARARLSWAGCPGDGGEPGLERGPRTQESPIYRAPSPLFRRCRPRLTRRPARVVTLLGPSLPPAPSLWFLEAWFTPLATSPDFSLECNASWVSSSLLSDHCAPAPLSLRPLHPPSPAGQGLSSGPCDPAGVFLNHYLRLRTPTSSGGGNDISAHTCGGCADEMQSHILSVKQRGLLASILGLFARPKLRA